VENNDKQPMTARQYLEKSGIQESETNWLLDILSFATEVAQKRHVDQNDINLLLSAIVDKKELLEMIRHQADELDAVRRIGLHLTASLDLPEVLASIVTEALRLVKDARDVHIFLYKDEKLTFGAALDAKGDRDNLFSEPRPNGLTNSVARQKQMIIVENMQTDPLFSGMPSDWTGSIIGLPLMVGLKVVGVMNLSRQTIGGFSDSEVRLLNLFADQAAVAVINARMHETVSRDAYTDVLTGLPNRRALDERLEKEVRRASRSGHPLSVVMMDLDGFGDLNDSYGHTFGDEVLRTTFSALADPGDWIRDTDFLARYGGDELTLVLPDTPLEQARVVASKLQRRLRSQRIQLPNKTQIVLNMTGGIAVMPGHARTAADLLRAADEALYRAKKHQRGTFLAAKPGTGQLPTL
jgi:diguanylate cyclase (GGDEF)-like protein